MDNDLDLSIAQVIKKYGLFDNMSRAKAFGQHFLCDGALLKKIASCALPLGDSDIIEIGPGPGGLTRAILNFAEKRKIICIEKDHKLKPLHDNLLKHSGANLKFIYADALNIRLSELDTRKLTIISNLPYNDIKNLEKLTSICFQHRRKAIYTTLKKAIPDFSQNILDFCEIEKNMRPEQISIDKFLKLSNLIFE